MRVNYIILIILIIFFLTPIYALNVATISFSKNVDEILPIFTADKVKVLTTSFSAEKNEIREVPVYITNAVNLSKAVVLVKYDNSVIRPENISSLDFNISYTIEDCVKITLDLNKSFTGDLLLAKIAFRAIGNEGDSTSLIIKVDKFLDNNSNEIPYLIIDGIFNIKIKDKGEFRNGNSKLGDTLTEFLNAENKSKFASENNLVFKDNKIKVIIETNNTTEIRSVNIDELLNLTKNETIKNIRVYTKTSNKELIIIGFVLVIIITVFILKFLK